MLQTTIVAGLALLLIAGGWRIGRSRLGARRESLEAGSMAFMNRMQASREAALDPAVQLAKRQLAERERAQAQEFESALGGPGGRALKDPALSLEGMIREWTQSVAPSGSIVVAQVDRFIEFSLLVELPRPAST
ncbi:MAG: hypothetical protein HYR88_15250, partial [Verrucomicrobia bacterium]|nr:hypothetical protein [Verrucomicrobiota bacterium]